MSVALSTFCFLDANRSTQRKAGVCYRILELTTSTRRDQMEKRAEIEKAGKCWRFFLLFVDFSRGSAAGSKKIPRCSVRIARKM